VVDEGELRWAYRTLDDPVRWLGVSLVGWITLLAAGGAGYGWLLLSPLGWRASVSVAVIALGSPALLLVLRESSTVGPGRLLCAVVRWRLRSPVIVAPSAELALRCGGVHLDTPAPEPAPADRVGAGSWWPEADGEAWR
jgi:hypothetical protein